MNNIDTNKYTGEVLLNCFYANNDKKDKVDIEELAAFFGFRVVGSDELDENIDARMRVFVIDNHSRTIVVNNFLSLEMRRYAIAYELAYYFLNYRGERTAFKHTGIDTISDRADTVGRLAISLIIDEYNFQNFYDSLGSDLSKKEKLAILKERFEVPSDVIADKVNEIASCKKLLVKQEVCNNIHN